MAGSEIWNSTPSALPTVTVPRSGSRKVRCSSSQSARRRSRVGMALSPASRLSVSGSEFDFEPMTGCSSEGQKKREEGSASPEWKSLSFCPAARGANSPDKLSLLQPRAAAEDAFAAGHPPSPEFGGGRLEALELGENLLHHLGSPSADGDQPDVAPGTGDVGLVDVAHAAEKLLAVVCHPLGEVPGEELGHGDFAHRVLLSLEEVHCVVGEPLGGLDGGEVLDEFVPPHLEAEDGTSKRPPFAAPGHRLLH